MNQVDSLMSKLHMYSIEMDGYQPENWDANERKMLRMRDELSVLLRKVKEIMAKLEQVMVEHIDEFGDIAVDADERLYVGKTVVHKSIDDQAILMAVLEVGNGNLELLTTGEGGMLASQPWKHGALTKLLGKERVNALFETSWRQDIKSGKVLRSVKRGWKSAKYAD